MLVCRSAARRKEAQKVSVGLVVLDREKLEPIACQRRIIVGSRKKMNLMLTIVFGVVGLVLSYGFSVPSEPSTFRLIAAAGVMVGYQLGQLAGRFVRPRPKRFLALIGHYIRYREPGCAARLVFFLARIFIALHTGSERNRKPVVEGLASISRGALGIKATNWGAPPSKINHNGTQFQRHCWCRQLPG
jgi:hypothetical protein